MTKKYWIWVGLICNLPLSLWAQHAVEKRVWLKNRSHVPIRYDDNAEISGTIRPDTGSLPKDLKGRFILVFADEFEGKNLDYDLQHVDAIEQSNKKWEMIPQESGRAYLPSTAQNISLNNGNLLLKTEAWRDPTTNDITGSTAAIQSRMYFRFGYIEGRMKIPYRNVQNTGLFPAFWIYRHTERYEEFDIFEFFQHLTPQNRYRYKVSQHCDTLRTISNPHVPTATLDRDIVPIVQKGNATYKLNMAKDFFIWGLRWTPDSLIYYLNQERIGAMRNCYSITNPFLQDGKHVILNVRPVWEKIRELTDFPCNFEIDYVRVYKEEKEFEHLLRTQHLSQFPKDTLEQGKYYYYWLEDYFPKMKTVFSFLSPEGKPLPTQSGIDNYKHFATFQLPADLPTGDGYKIQLKIDLPAPHSSQWIHRTIEREVFVRPKSKEK